MATNLIVDSNINSTSSSVQTLSIMGQGVIYLSTLNRNTHNSRLEAMFSLM